MHSHLPSQVHMLSDNYSCTNQSSTQPNEWLSGMQEDKLTPMQMFSSDKLMQSVAVKGFCFFVSAHQSQKVCHTIRGLFF